MTTTTTTAKTTVFTATGCPPLAPPPDDLTLPQFFLDSHNPLRQIREGSYNAAPWLIEDETGKGTWFILCLRDPPALLRDKSRPCSSWTAQRIPLRKYAPGPLVLPMELQSDGALVSVSQFAVDLCASKECADRFIL